MNSKTYKFVHEMHAVPEVNVIVSYFCYLWSYIFKSVSPAPLCSI